MLVDNEIVNCAHGSTAEDPMNGSNEFYIRTHGITRKFDALKNFAEIDAMYSEANIAPGATALEATSETNDSDQLTHTN